MDPSMSVPTADPSRVELRGDIDRDVADVLDAVAKARRVSRMDVVASVLGDWAKDKIHESTIVLRLARGQGNATER